MENPQSTPRDLYDRLHEVDASPWMEKTRTWVENQGFWGPRFASETTKEWVWAQRMLELEASDAERREKEKAAERKWWEATTRIIDEQAKRWMVQAEASRKAALRETEKTRKIQEEVRRVKERSEGREAEKRRIREETQKIRERSAKRTACENAAKTLIDAWNAYERRWAALQASSKEGLTFRAIPWPIVGTPSSPSSISDANVALFLLSPLHSGDKSNKDRIREAMQRWHTDKFEPRILPRVVESERNAVKEGVGIVVRCLNNLLARQSSSLA